MSAVATTGTAGPAPRAGTPASVPQGSIGWGTGLRLAATGGSADGTRIALTALGAAAGTLALLAAVTVAVTGPGDGPYTSALLNESGLHPGIVAALVLLCLPVLAFVGQCARIGAPARDRRLAALRLQGATPADVVRVAAGETGLAAGVGAASGAALYFLLRALLGGPVVATYPIERQISYDNGSIGYVVDTFTGAALRLPTDVAPPLPALALVVVAVPVIAGALSALALRRVTLSPFGVVRREQTRPVRVLPALLFLVGTAGLMAFAAVRRLFQVGQDSPGAVGAVVFLLFLLTAAGLLLGTSALSAGIGQALATRTGRPSLLLAGRRLLAAPVRPGALMPPSCSWCCCGRSPRACGCGCSRRPTRTSPFTTAPSTWSTSPLRWAPRSPQPAC